MFECYIFEYCRIQFKVKNIFKFEEFCCCCEEQQVEICKVKCEENLVKCCGIGIGVDCFGVFFGVVFDSDDENFFSEFQVCL